MMNLNYSLLVSLFLLFHTANAFNITNLLTQYPSFSTFNSYLTQTQLAGDINSRRTITVLAVDNSGMSPLSGKPADVLKKIMSVHVVLDYYDVPKLQKLSNKTALLTTLFQSSGQASGQQGFLNVTDLSTGAVVFGSAVHGSTLGANLVKTVATQPYNLSVLQISTVIIPTGIDGSKPNSTASPPASPSPAKPPSKSPANSPTTAPPSKAPAPSKAATPDAGPPNADAPGSPPKPTVEPGADAPAADAPADDKSAGTAGGGIALGFSLSVVMIIVSALSAV